MNNKFFKIKIQRLLDRLPTPVQFNESQWAMVENLDQSRFCVHIAARRTGKSYAAAILAFAKLLEPGQQVMVVAPNFSLSSIIWDYVTDLIRQLDIEVERFNQKDKVVKLINGSVFRLLSANNRDSLVGRAANLLIVDEAAIIPNDEYFTRDLRPALSTFTDSRCLWISTPRGKGNYLYDYYLRGADPEYPDWTSSIHNWRANPLLSETDVEEARRTITKALYLQEYECEWTTTESQIYLDLDEEKHIGDYIGERFAEVIGGLDVGYRDENVFVVIGTDGENYFIVDEFISKESTTSELASEIQEKINEWGIDTIYIDSAAQQLKLILLMIMIFIVKMQLNLLMMVLIRFKCLLSKIACSLILKGQDIPSPQWQHINGIPTQKIQNLFMIGLLTLVMLYVMQSTHTKK